MSSTNTHSHRDKYPGTFVFVFVFAFTSGCDLQITPTTLIYPRISMQCRNGSESRHLINMPFIWPLHTSLKQEPLLQHRAAQGASLQPVPENCSLLLVQAAHPGALATKCSQQKLCGSFAIASIATPPRLSPQLGSGLHCLQVQAIRLSFCSHLFACHLLRLRLLRECFQGTVRRHGHVCRDASYL